jgi:AcrR family transcriptional regulator
MTTRDSPRRVDGRTTRWAGQHERRRAEFVEAALVAIAHHGPDVSTEQIAEQAGVARTRLYKHFTDARDLQRSIARRTADLVVAELEPALNTQGSAIDMITTVLDTHMRWMAENHHLYRYLTMHSPIGTRGDPSAFTSVKTAIARQLSRLFAHYLDAFGLDTGPAEPLAFGVVGFVESSTSHWLEHPGDMSRADITHHLARWIWCMLDDTLQAGGVHLDPHEPLTPHPDLGGDSDREQPRAG